jgi:hypothetical protein
MGDHDAPEQEAQLSQRELARLRARDRKRTTRMVVDNAGIKRILLARRDRAAGRASDKHEVPAGQQPGERLTGGW